MPLTIGDPWPAWHALVRRGMWESSGRTLEVLVVLTPQPVGDLPALRANAATALQVRGNGVLPLLGIEAVGEGAAWIYPFRELVSPAFFTEPTLGHRAAAELVRDVALVLVDHPHPGPRLEDVLIDPEGGVWVANFAGPSLPLAEAPGPHDTEAAAVYRLGALLATLLAGSIKPGSTAAAHDAAVRRTVIRAMSMPGAVFSDQYADWLRGMLAWDPALRPPLSRVSQGLGALAETSGGLPLRAVAKSGFQDWTHSAQELHTPQTLPTLSGSQTISQDHEYAGRTTLAHEHIISDLAYDDDRTMESEFPDPVERTPPSVLERGTIPVEVGPPVEAIQNRRPTLPPGFLDPRSGDTLPALAARARQPDPELDEARAQPWVLPTAVGLSGLALLLLAWLLLG